MIKFNQFLDKFFSMLGFPLMNEPIAHNESRIVNPRAGDPHGLPEPLREGDVGFIAAHLEVLAVVMMVGKGLWPSEFLKKHALRPGFCPLAIPPVLVDFGIDIAHPQRAARSVHMDDPLTVYQATLEWLLGQNVQLKPQYRTTAHRDFIGAHIETNQAYAVRQAELINRAFDAKWFYGAERTREWLTSYVDWVQPYDVTIDADGMGHPRYPAGHAALFSALMALIERFELTTEQENAILDTVYLCSMFRTLGGFHTAEDNIAGMQLGGVIDWINANR